MKKLILLILITSCALVETRPKEVMSIAQAAFLAAKNANSAQYASNLYKQAENSYLKAKSAYKKKYFNKAKKYAKMTIYFSERAEVESLRIQTFESNSESGGFNEDF